MKESLDLHFRLRSSFFVFSLISLDLSSYVWLAGVLFSFELDMVVLSGVVSIMLEDRVSRDLLLAYP
jgi:hypothetical protein